MPSTGWKPRSPNGLEMTNVTSFGKLTRHRSGGQTGEEIHRNGCRKVCVYKCMCALMCTCTQTAAPSVPLSQGFHCQSDKRDIWDEWPSSCHKPRHEDPNTVWLACLCVCVLLLSSMCKHIYLCVMQFPTLELFQLFPALCSFVLLCLCVV